MYRFIKRREKIDSLGRQTITSDAAGTLVLRALDYTAAFVTAVVLARALGPQGTGNYFLVAIATTTLAMISSLGLGQGNLYLYATGRTTNSLAAQNSLVSVTVGVPAGVLLLVAPKILPAIFAGIPVNALALAAVSVPLLVHSQLTAGLQILLRNVTWSFFASLIGRLSQLVLVVILAITSGLSVELAVAANLTGAVVSWAVTMTARGRSGLAAPRANLALLRESLSHSIWLYLGVLFLFLHFRADWFLVQAMAGSATLGVYTLAVVLAETVLLATDSVSIAVLPVQVKNTLGEAARLAIQMGRMTLLLALFLGLLWVALGWLLVPLVFGQDFASSYVAVVALLPGIAARSIQRLCGAVVLRVDRPGKLAAINGVALALNLALNLVFVPSLGSLGASIASSISYITSAFAFVAWMTASGDGLHIRDLIPQRSDVSTLLRAGASVFRSLGPLLRDV